MKRFIILSICGALVFAGCNRKNTQKEEGELQPESANKNDNLVEMSVSAQQHIGMVIAPAALTQLNEYLRATGTVQPIDNRVGGVGPPARGRIVEVRAKVGDRVGAGQTLAVFDNIEAGELLSQEQSARADLERLKAQLIAANRQAERSRRLADIGAGAEKDYESNRAEKEGIEANIRSQQALLDGIGQRLRRFGASDDSPRATFLTPLKAPSRVLSRKRRHLLGTSWTQGGCIHRCRSLARLGSGRSVREGPGAHPLRQFSYGTSPTCASLPWCGVDSPRRTARERSSLVLP